LPFDSLDRLARKLTEVTAEQVQAVARKYLVDDNLTLAVLDPQPMSARKPGPPPPAEHTR
jgi:zinc protease